MDSPDNKPDGMCQKIGCERPGTALEHPCPWRVANGGDDSPCCNCCEACELECADEV